MRHVVATAGHVDHGKSALVRGLTGIEPDRYAEEQRRGMTLDLGFAWTTLPSGAAVAFVDVPGHERFVSTMLAGVGPVPAVMVVVAADEGWRQQSEEHLAALDALEVRHGLLVVTKSDLADPQPTAAQARERIARSSLGDLPWVAVSAVTGAGLPTLRQSLDDMLRAVPPQQPGPVRLWVDRSFSIRGAGTVVTGTLGAGALSVGDELELAPAGARAVVKGLQSMQQTVDTVSPVSRVAVNLRGVRRDDARRGMALVSPGSWTIVADVDVRFLGADRLRPRLTVHLGSAAVPARVRMLGEAVARLRLDHALPLHVGDRLLLRDPGTRIVVAAVVADVDPAPLTRRGDARSQAAALREGPSADAHVERRGVVSAAALTAAGYGDGPRSAIRVGDWWVAGSSLERWRQQLVRDLAAVDDPLAGGLSADAVRHRLGIPDQRILAQLVAATEGLRLRDGRVSSIDAAVPDLPALRALLERLAADPFDAPEAHQLALTPAELAHAVRSGALLPLGRDVYVSPTAPAAALARLAEIEQPFTVSEARQALGTSRRIAVPLLEHLDGLRRTRRLDDARREVVVQPQP